MTRFVAFASDSEDDGSVSDDGVRHSPSVKVTNSVVVSKTASSSSASSSASSSSSSASGSDVDRRDFREDNNLDEDETAIDGMSEDESTPWPQQLNLESQRVHVMQTSLFRMPELAKSQATEPTSYLKHPRAPTVGIEKQQAPQRTSFVQPRPQPPPRKYVRVSEADSIAWSHDGVYLDTGLSFGRSFRIGWGPRCVMAHVGGLYSSGALLSGANTSTVNLTTVQLTTTGTSVLLPHLLSQTQIVSPHAGSDNAPYITYNRDLNFASFAFLFGAADDSHVASLFRLGHALFDNLEDHLGDDVAPDVRNRVRDLRRRDELSLWLERAVKSSVEQDLKAHASADSAKIAFLQLSGHQIEEAVNTLIDTGNVRLATLISQLPGDLEFRSDIQEQLRVWRDEKVDALMNGDIRRLYVLAGGEIDILEGSGRKEDTEVGKGLDWLRVFGLQLWFASSLDMPLQDSFQEYERLLQISGGRITHPHPWYATEGSSSGATNGLFALMKLALSPSTTLESALSPLSFNANPRDFSIPWFLYVLLSRCLRLRDFSDRQVELSDDDMDYGETPNGYSSTADILTSNYAAQLQQEGLVQEAAFVLLFLEDGVGRKLALKELLSRSAPLLDEWTVAGLQGSLKIPREWIEVAKATYALYSGDVFGAYDLFKQANAHQSAYDLAITYLAPEAILRDDLELLSGLFTSLDETQIPDFGIGGQLFIDYVNIITQVPELRQKQQVENAVPDAAEELQLETLTSRIPRLVGILPDVLREKSETGGRCKAALSVMLSNLLECLDTSKPVHIEIQPGLVEEAARLRHIHAAAYGSFLRTIAAVA